MLDTKWRARLMGRGDLLAFRVKLEQKPASMRGFFVSCPGFTAEGRTAFGVGKRLLCMHGRNLYDALGQQTPFRAVLERKVSRDRLRVRAHWRTVRPADEGRRLLVVADNRQNRPSRVSTPHSPLSRVRSRILCLWSQVAAPGKSVSDRPRQHAHRPLVAPSGQPAARPGASAAGMPQAWQADIMGAPLLLDRSS